jgi:hypothetical protein
MKNLFLQKNKLNSFPFQKMCLCAFLLLMIYISDISAKEYTRGVGVYPGDRKEDFSPTMKIDSMNYRNLALHRPAYHSSCYNYNLTAQLITDGIKE